MLDNTPDPGYNPFWIWIAAGILIAILLKNL
jgi:hypothetical protein